ncbi:hypothetical protein AKJ09_04155 [Labilithrix luteola]|uniref:Peptidase C-terminal archaeal/bacterial domain-containing protein n=1 Tax=Labilithrix luteola TaxID=1391654 RepID=A0A0K1PVT0_9BACT|nr:hypothetical protein [Labilithrix luteola]AKU97491.1 hypothetical protein AKJ09_04155 [Labilithrix luteola]
MKKISFVCLGAFLAMACSASAPEGEVAESADSALRVPTTAEILGTIDYGQSLTAEYTEVPSFRAYRLAGKSGDSFDLWVRSPSGGDAVAWLLRSDGKTLVKNDDADGTTSDAHIALTLPRTENYFVVFRDANYEDNTFTVSLGGGGGSGAAVPSNRLGSTVTAQAQCGFLIEWATFVSSSSTCPDFGYGWSEPVDLTFRIEGTETKPVLVADAFSFEKVVSSDGGKKTIGWPETRIELDPASGKGSSNRYSNVDNRPGPNTYCYGISKGQTVFNGSVTGDKISFEMFENLQHNTCCASKRRTAQCTLTIP